LVGSDQAQHHQADHRDDGDHRGPGERNGHGGTTTPDAALDGRCQVRIVRGPLGQVAKKHAERIVEVTHQDSSGQPVGQPVGRPVSRFVNKVHGAAQSRQTPARMGPHGAHPAAQVRGDGIVVQSRVVPQHQHDALMRGQDAERATEFIAFDDPVRPGSTRRPAWQQLSPHQAAPRRCSASAASPGTRWC
jgi:hypothetical protein